MDKVRGFTRRFGLPRIIILCFFFVLVICAAAFKMDLLTLLSDCVRRWGMFGVLVLAMVPSVQCGIGLNFGISMGIVGGLLGGLIVIETGVAKIPALVAVSPFFAQWCSLLIAILIGVAIATGIGFLYGLLLNRVKGAEMTVTTYVGFSIIAFMNIMWVCLPFREGELIQPNAGAGLRPNVALDSSFGETLNNTLNIKIGSLEIPTGLILFFLMMCLLVWLFTKSKTGRAMAAAGANPQFARASGINVNKMRIIGTMLSTVIAAVGIVVYAQGFGLMQLYNGPMMMGFVSVASILIGGASPRRARVSNVLLGTFLYQGLLALGLPVANNIMPGSSMSEIMRLIVSNGIIIYALTQVGGGAARE